ncbi:peptidoglycan bridge formation glycyltransferase FemA/FemB family protein, partial [Candidatus Poribacteria bacterium]|nr:peptidoglycan bridge formation glycyltransferase FemA/FemB family protein [Candidatus Poribacteria bacterium]
MSPLRLDPADDPQAWDDYVSAMPGVCAFHSRTWKQALSAAFPQYRPADAFLVRGDDRIGAWSGCVFTPAPFVSFAESSPWHLYGGPVGVAPEDLLDAVACWESCSRRDRACALSLTLPPGDFAASHGVLTEIGFALTEPKHTHVLDLPSDADTLWSGYKGSVRTDVRKATGAGVTVRPVHGDAEIGAFYAVYRATMDRFGSVSKPRSMVADLARSSIATLFMAERAGIPVAGLLLLVFGKVATVWMAASEPAERRHAPNHLLYHTALTWAMERGYERADFGASPPENTGLVKFKESF